jgi:archaellum biogenesis ATPase FlaH
MNFGPKIILIFTHMYTIMLTVETKALADNVLSGIKSTTSFMEELWEERLGEAAMYRLKRRLSPCCPGEKRANA